MTESHPEPESPAQPVSKTTDEGAAADVGPEPTGVPAADQARERLAAVAGAPLEEHVEDFEDVHRRLQEGLADLDER
jgi:hypothetical protein